MARATTGSSSPDKVLCSIITITKNNLPGLQATVDSVGQLRADFEHVVIDGASGDGTVGWLQREFRGPRRLWNSASDTGIYDAMNRGRRLSQGRILCFLNAGDRLADPQVLATLVDELAACDRRWLMARMCFVRADGRQAVRPRVTRYRWWWQTFVSYSVCHPATLVKADLLDAFGGFDERLSIASDYKFFTWAGRTSAPIVSTATMCHFEGGGVSDTRIGESLRECSQARAEVLRYSLVGRLLDRMLTEVLVALRSLHRSRRLKALGSSTSWSLRGRG